MKAISDLIGKRVTVILRDLDDVDGTLLSIEDGGYFIKVDENNFCFIPEANNVIKVDYRKE